MAAANFKNCLPIILGFEGGRSNDRQDPGGRTNKGITQRTYNAWRDRKGWERVDVYSIPYNDVVDIYLSEYWNAINGDWLRPGEDLVVFDFAVNSGPARARSAWVHAVKDHIIAGGGSAARELQAVIGSVCASRLAFMKGLRTWPHFGVGWARRVALVQEHGLAMAAGNVPQMSASARSSVAGIALIGVSSASVAALHLAGAPLAATATGASVVAGGAISALVSDARMRWKMAARAVEPEITTKKPNS